MTPIYKVLNIPTLKTIQEEVLKVVPLTGANAIQGLTYSHGSNVIHSRCPTLVDFFKNIGVPLDSIFTGVNITPPWGVSDIHIDVLDRTILTINIPIVNCENTFLHFFKANGSGEYGDYGKLGKSLYYTKYKEEDTELIGTLETSTPYILNLSTPHRFDNSKCSAYRFMLLNRIKVEHTLANEIVSALLSS